jgi:hypothetical protein
MCTGPVLRDIAVWTRLLACGVPVEDSARPCGTRSEVAPLRGGSAWAGQSTTAPPVKLISLAVIVRAQADAAKVAMLATST